MKRQQQPSIPIGDLPIPCEQHPTLRVVLPLATKFFRDEQIK
ncbi:hypothetical protein [Pseudomonas gingeri]|nr:hypothetical protein [Pseudomonas gingeri]